MALIARLLPWILPPVLGAIIGYVTNAIAIRMLFRPFNEIRIFGIRLPFTPGLIPRERGQLAESMARMVSTELLTDTALRAQIHSPSFRTAMEQNVASLTSQILSMPLAEAGSSLFGERAPGATGAGSLGALLSTALSGFSHSPGFKLLIRSLVTRLVDNVASRPVKDVVAGGGFAGGIIDRFVSSLSSDHGRQEIRRGVSSWVERELAANEKLSRYLKAEDGEALAGFIDRVYPALASLIVKWLRSEPMRRELAVRGRFLVQDIVDRLTGLQRLIISAAQYQRTLDENMGKIVGDALDAIEEALFDDKNRGRIVETLRREVGVARERGVGDLAGAHKGAVTEAAAGIAERVVGALSEPAVRDGVAGILGGGDESMTIAGLLSRLFDLNGTTPGQFVADLLLPLGETKVAEKSAAAFAAAGGASAAMPAAAGAGDGGSANAAPESERENSLAVPGMVERFFRDFFSAHGDTRIGEFLGMDDATKASLDLALSSTLIAAVDARAGEIIASVNVRELVVSKINGLNIEEVEGLLLQLIQKHLQYINLFGGILGALIGLVQDFARLVHLSS